MPEGQQPEDNPYLVTQVADVATSVSDRSKPGAVAIVFSVVTGLAVAVVTFCATFFVTCLGVASVDSLRGESGGVILLFVVSGLTTVAAFVFTVSGLLKIARSLTIAAVGVFVATCLSGLYLVTSVVRLFGLGSAEVGLAIGLVAATFASVVSTATFIKVFRGVRSSQKCRPAADKLRDDSWKHRFEEIEESET